jgi:hypothetical protein
MNSVKNRWMELREQDSKERDPKKLLALQNLKPRICYVLSLLRIHSPECKHCIARLTCGNELRKRLEELNGRTQPCSDKNGDHRELRQAG